MNKFIKTMLILLALISFASTANANADGAKTFVKDIATTSLAIMKSDKIPDEQKEVLLSSIFENALDTAWMARFVLGRYWREASAEDQAEFTKLYKDFLVNMYVPKFKQFTNQDIVFGSSREDSGTEYTIETKIVLISGESITVDYSVREGPLNEYKIFDIAAERISLITTQRAEFSSILSRNSLRFLITQLKIKLVK